MQTTPALTPLVLVVDAQEPTARAIEHVLRPKGHVVLKAQTGQQALDLAAKVSPDAILIDLNLTDMDSIDLLHRLKESPTCHSTTPILVVSSLLVGKAQRLEALSAGAWDVLVHPLEPSELILRMDTFVRSKQEADRARDQGLTDPGTGFYNVRGILRRTREINADTVRSDRPLTCIAFGTSAAGEGLGPESDEASSAIEASSGPVAAALRHVTRISDTLGRLGPGEFVVVAPGTDRAGAVRLADRVLESLLAGSPEDTTASSDLRGKIRAGLCSVESSESTSAEDLLLRATMALRQAQADDGSFRVRSFEA